MEPGMKEVQEKDKEEAQVKSQVPITPTQISSVSAVCIDSVV
jgi:hypothetical protein